MITWKQLLFNGNHRKLILTLFIVSNVLFALSATYTLYFKEASFDMSKRPFVDARLISKIDVREGGWKWKDGEWPFSNSSKLTLTTRHDINIFCNVLRSAPSKYINNIRAIQRINIYFTESGDETLSILIKENYQGEIFIKYDDHTYDGTQIVSLLKLLSVNREK